MGRLTAAIGRAIRDERRGRAWTMREVAARAGVAPSVVHAAEQGRPVSMESWLRISTALDLRPDLTLTPARRRGTPTGTDLVHAAMAEVQTRHLRATGLWLGIDEPDQHYQFAGRADVLAVDVERRALLHLENRTRFPNLQDVAGAYNAKRTYLAAVIGRRLGVSRWASETHVLAALWSAEALHAVRLRIETFRAMCRDPDDAFQAWWAGRRPRSGSSSTIIVFDPAPDLGRRRRFVGLEDVLRVDPRYRDYADAARRLG